MVQYSSLLRSFFKKQVSFIDVRFVAEFGDAGHFGSNANESGDEIIYKTNVLKLGMEGNQNPAAFVI